MIARPCSKPGGAAGRAVRQELRIVDRRQDALDRATGGDGVRRRRQAGAQHGHDAGHHRRKELEASLREQREFFQLISESIGEHIAVLDLQGRRLYNSPSYRQLFGDARDLHGSDSFGDVHPDDRERVRRVFARPRKPASDRRSSIAWCARTAASGTWLRPAR
jgi:PAS domain S-box-containing protein